jgi:hypothetical protein
LQTPSSGAGVREGSSGAGTGRGGCEEAIDRCFESSRPREHWATSKFVVSIQIQFASALAQVTAMRPTLLVLLVLELRLEALVPGGFHPFAHSASPRATEKDAREISTGLYLTTF